MAYCPTEPHRCPCGPALWHACFLSPQPSLCQTRTLHQVVLGAKVVTFEVVQTAGSRGATAILSVSPCEAPLTGSAEQLPTEGCAVTVSQCTLQWRGRAEVTSGDPEPQRPALTSQTCQLCHLASAATAGPVLCTGQCLGFCEPQAPTFSGGI